MRWGHSSASLRSFPLNRHAKIFKLDSSDPDPRASDLEGFCIISSVLRAFCFVAAYNSRFMSTWSSLSDCMALSMTRPSCWILLASRRSLSALSLSACATRCLLSSLLALRAAVAAIAGDTPSSSLFAASNFSNSLWSLAITFSLDPPRNCPVTTSVTSSPKSATTMSSGTTNPALVRRGFWRAYFHPAAATRSRN